VYDSYNKYNEYNETSARLQTYTISLTLPGNCYPVGNILKETL